MEDFIKQFAELLEIDGAEISEDTKLDTIEDWDSLALVSFIALADQKYGKQLSGQELLKAQAIADLYHMVNG